MKKVIRSNILKLINQFGYSIKRASAGPNSNTAFLASTMQGFMKPSKPKAFWMWLVKSIPAPFFGATE
jgi:hypothetical protein